MRTPLFWIIKQCVAVISYRHLRTTYSPQTPEDGTDKDVPKCQEEITTTHCVITQKSVVLIYFVAES